MKRRGFLAAIFGALTLPLTAKLPDKAGRFLGFKAFEKIGPCYANPKALLEFTVRQRAEEYKEKFGDWPRTCLLGIAEFRILVKDGYTYGEGFQHKDIFGEVQPPIKYFICADMIVMLSTGELPFQGKASAYLVTPDDICVKGFWEKAEERIVPSMIGSFQGLAGNSELYDSVMSTRAHCYEKVTDLHG